MQIPATPRKTPIASTIRTFLLALCGVLGSAGAIAGQSYYIDSEKGDDTRPGTSAAAAWQSLHRLLESRFGAGDHIFLVSGSRWHEPLVLRDSGTADAPIQVDSIGPGNLPRVDADGKFENAVEILNAEYIHVRHLEITNHSDERALLRGVLVSAVNSGTLHDISISDLYVHDVSGEDKGKNTAAIMFRTMGDSRPSRFDGLDIERNIIWRAGRSGIAGKSSQWKRSAWYPSLHVRIRDNYVADVAGDGIVPWATDGALVEHNIVMRAASDSAEANAGIWPWSADNTLFQLNEAAYTHGTRDGEGFDSDWNSRGTTFAYNYSHENDGGFMLICTPVARDETINFGNQGTVIRNNISRHDKTRIFHLVGADHTIVEDNVVYVGPDDDVNVLLVSDWQGWSTDALFRDNVFDVAGTARYGHAMQNADGSFDISPGWGPARDIRFENNVYYGLHIDPPRDAFEVNRGSNLPTDVDWLEPVFDPSSVAGFSEFLAAHRRWLMTLFTRHFGQPPHLLRAIPFAQTGSNSGDERQRLRVGRD